MKSGFQGSRSVVIPQFVIDKIEGNMFSSKLHVTDIGYYPSAMFHKVEREKGAPQNILIYCTNGKGWYTINGEKREVKANECFIIPTNTPHSYGANRNDPWTIYWLHFSGEVANFYANHFKRLITINPSENSRIRERLHIFEDIFNALSSGYDSENLEFASSALYYFLGSIKYIDTYRNIATNSDDEHHNTIVGNAISFMKENIERPLTLHDICQFAGYSESHFSTLFKSKTGHTPINYMIQLRIDEAAKLLEFTSLKINQICFKIGISDPFYFSKLFTKIIGIPPTQYRLERHNQKR